MLLNMSVIRFSSHLSFKLDSFLPSLLY